MNPTIKPGHYGRIALHHKHVAATARAVGDQKTADKESRLCETTLRRAHAVRDQLKRGQS